MRISIIIPVYNEFCNLHQVIERVLNAPFPPNCTKEIIVVDDGSTDGTSDLVRKYAEAGVVLGQCAGQNNGKGSAISSGIALASGDVVLVQDGDLEYDPGDYVALLTPIVSREAAVVYGSRFRGSIVGMARKNWVANKTLTFTANLLYGAQISDEATAYKAFRTDVLRSLELTSQRFEFCSEVTAKVCRLGYKIREVPISYIGRSNVEGKKVRAKDGFWALWTLVKYRFVARNNVTAGRSAPACSLAIVTTPGATVPPLDC